MAVRSFASGKKVKIPSAILGVVLIFGFRFSKKAVEERSPTALSGICSRGDNPRDESSESLPGRDLPGELWAGGR